jgi:hypothetical protein
MFKHLIAICLITFSMQSFARDIKHDDYVLRNGIFSPVYGEISNQFTNEFGKSNSLLNVKIGIQAVRFDDHGIFLSGVRRGFNTAHSRSDAYKVDFMGLGLEYGYYEHDVRPVVGLFYLHGKKQEKTDNHLVKMIDDMDKIEVSTSLFYHVPFMFADVFVGYHHSFDTTDKINRETTILADSENHTHKLTTLSKGVKSTSGSAVMGLRFITF